MYTPKPRRASVPPASAPNTVSKRLIRMEALMLEMRQDQVAAVARLVAIQAQCDALTDVAYGVLARLTGAPASVRPVAVRTSAPTDYAESSLRSL